MGSILTPWPLVTLKIAGGLTVIFDKLTACLVEIVVFALTTWSLKTFFRLNSRGKPDAKGAPPQGVGGDEHDTKAHELVNRQQKQKTYLPDVNMVTIECILSYINI
jgi:hypothetical protein